MCSILPHPAPTYSTVLNLLTTLTTTEKHLKMSDMRKVVFGSSSIFSLIQRVPQNKRDFSQITWEILSLPTYQKPIVTASACCSINEP